MVMPLSLLCDNVSPHGERRHYKGGGMLSRYPPGTQQDRCGTTFARRATTLPAGEVVFSTLDMIGIPGYRPASRIGSRSLRAEILGKRHAGRLACCLRVSGHLDAQITHAGLGISRQAVEYLLPTSNQVQLGRVR